MLSMIVLWRQTYIILLVRWCHCIWIFFLNWVKHIIFRVKPKLISHRIITFIVLAFPIWIKNAHVLTRKPNRSFQRTRSLSPILRLLLHTRIISSTRWKSSQAIPKILLWMLKLAWLMTMHCFRCSLHRRFLIRMASSFGLRVLSRCWILPGFVTHPFFEYDLCFDLVLDSNFRLFFCFMIWHVLFNFFDLLFIAKFSHGFSKPIFKGSFSW